MKKLKPKDRVVMDKYDVHKTVTSALLSRYETAKWAAKQAHEAATNEESVAENKYDTFGLEASYLAHGQSQRVLECEKDWLLFDKKQPVMCNEEEGVDLWSLVTLVDLESSCVCEKYFFISPCAGGLSVEISKKIVYLVTPSSPVGKVLLGKMVDDEVELRQSGKQMAYEITTIE
ncbi:transcription elongation factor GreAB [Marinomonas rhizomae]|uniref:GreA/GreB family elongation factor n=1 Tax=Marinomonas rhizomae TaxID=491948 RepID=A0A366JEH2_9GAMM|nr:GreA/GreB family elongation factor [Marinomonas rhizomae]RBP84685.1 GreA/GreB family elongation factor [Marinomonas rhizomae]RNF75111.1 transcription elongation factor GreAB [Marinomonas rhizomae]